MKQDVEEYIRYYNQNRLHITNNDLSPVEFELSQLKCQVWLDIELSKRFFKGWYPHG